MSINKWISGPWFHGLIDNKYIQTYFYCVHLAVVIQKKNSLNLLFCKWGCNWCSVAAWLLETIVRPQKKLLCCPHPTKIWKLGRLVDFFNFFFFFFFFTYRERVEFSNIFFKFLNGENSGGMQSKRIYKCFFRPLNTHFSKFFAQIWHFQKKKKKKKKKKPTLFFRILRSVGRGQHNFFFFFGLMDQYSSAIFYI